MSSKTISGGAVARFNGIDSLRYRKGYFEIRINGNGIETSLITKSIDCAIRTSQWKVSSTIMKKIKVTIEKRLRPSPEELDGVESISRIF